MSPVSETFGQIITGYDVEVAAQETLETWLETYIAEMERQQGRVVESVPLPRTINVMNGFEKWPEDQLPCLLIVSTGLIEEPMRLGDGTYWAKWDLVIGAITSARTQAESWDLAKLYGAAIRALILQNQTLGGFSRGCDWITERYDDLSIEDHRSLASATVAFSVEVESVVRDAGPSTVPIDPYASPDPLAIVSVTDVVLENEDV